MPASAIFPNNQPNIAFLKCLTKLVTNCIKPSFTALRKFLTNPTGSFNILVNTALPFLRTPITDLAAPPA